MYKFKSYLQLNDKLSQLWLNKYTIILLLSFFKIFFFYISICNELNSSKQFIISHCGTIDSIYYNFLTNTQSYLNSMGNYLTEKTMEETIKSILTILSLLVTASEELVTFIIDLYLGTYTCLLVSTIDGAVDIATNTTENLISIVNTTVSTFADDLENGLNDVSIVLNKIISSVSKIKNFLKNLDSNNSNKASEVTDNIKKVNLTINSLRNLYIPSSINEKLKELSAKTPDFHTVKNETKSLIAKPFQIIKNDIASINVSKVIAKSNIHGVYQTHRVAEDNTSFIGICSSNTPDIEYFFQEINKNLKTVTIILLVLLVFGACVMMLPEAWKEIKQWKKLKHFERDIFNKYNDILTIMNDKKEYEIDSNNNLDDSFDVIESYNRCFNVWQTKIYDFLIFLFTFNKKNYPMSKRKKLSWIISYIVSERAIFVLSIGILGIIVSCFQLIILCVLKRHMNKIESYATKNFVDSSNLDFLKKDLTIWTHNTNQYINYTESNINEQIFGWITIGTSSINNTIKTMMNGIDTTLSDLFNGTLLYKPMTTVVKCVIENKLYSIEQAMTWIHNKAHVSFPQINSTELVWQLKTSITQNSTIRVNNSIASGTIHNQELLVMNIWNEIQILLSSVLNSLHKTVTLELVISCIIISMWVIQIPLATLIMLRRQTQICQ